MSDVVYTRWSCPECKGKGAVSGPETDTSAEPNDPVFFNCFYCQGTVGLELPPGLHRRELRVEGEWDLQPAASCPRCQAPLRGFWDGRGSPLATCESCSYRERLPEPVPDPSAWETLLESKTEKIERRKVAGGWEFRSESYGPRRSKKKPLQDVTSLEGFEPEPGRPLREIFAEIRAEHEKLRRQGAGAEKSS